MSSSPCFCQYVTNEVFKQLIKLEFPLPSVAKDIVLCQPTSHPLIQMEKMPSDMLPGMFVGK